MEDFACGLPLHRGGVAKHSGTPSPASLDPTLCRESFERLACSHHADAEAFGQLAIPGKAFPADPQAIVDFGTDLEIYLMVKRDVRIQNVLDSAQAFGSGSRDPTLPP
ncbi:MAG: hypothetical protein A2W04_02940 [Betaproteobacteria bacterium RBG_16_64_9]|nr:MAG: hypothetical protein A2W04_02940 [Betaproteobacteria bacterium RBG_16_64_9]OGA88001.1 MAG: hypothetical protein A3G27_13665 [Betaproteobacteria bacterium RIFCSPLOWO2_12_FULL_66_14]